jgi:hypothetical protein
MMSLVDTHQFPVLNFPRTSNANSLQDKEITRGRENTKWDKPAKSRFSYTAGTLCEIFEPNFYQKIEKVIDNVP